MPPQEPPCTPPPSPTNPLQTPFLIKGVLREYQQIGLDWLVTLYHKRLNGGRGRGRAAHRRRVGPWPVGAPPDAAAGRGVDVRRGALLVTRPQRNSAITPSMPPCPVCSAGILADEMGLGKTIQTIALLAHLACEKWVGAVQGGQGALPKCSPIAVWPRHALQVTGLAVVEELQRLPRGLFLRSLLPQGRLGPPPGGGAHLGDAQLGDGVQEVVGWCWWSSRARSQLHGMGGTQGHLMGWAPAE